jgi:hypothetical protein
MTDTDYRNDPLFKVLQKCYERDGSTKNYYCEYYGKSIEGILKVLVDKAIPDVNKEYSVFKVHPSVGFNVNYLYMVDINDSRRYIRIKIYYYVCEIVIGGQFKGNTHDKFSETFHWIDGQLCQLITRTLKKLNEIPYD